VQDWLFVQFDEVPKDQPDDPELWSYELFPKLMASLCVMVAKIIRLIPSSLKHSVSISPSSQSQNGQAPPHNQSLTPAVPTSSRKILHHPQRYWAALQPFLLGTDVKFFGLYLWDTYNASN